MHACKKLPWAFFNSGKGIQILVVTLTLYLLLKCRYHHSLLVYILPISYCASIYNIEFIPLQNGGGAFLIPYALMLVLGAMPLMYMEVILGQFNRQGPISLWKICPLFKGKRACSTFAQA